MKSALISESSTHKNIFHLLSEKYGSLHQLKYLVSNKQKDIFNGK